MTDLPPLRRTVIVAAEPAIAFEVFTASIGAWWPLDTHGVFGEGATVGFDSGVIVERSPAGEQSVWGTVTQWEPPYSVAFTWHPGGTPERATAVTVTFAAAGDETYVTLEHAGWERLADAEGMRTEYEKGWAIVLGHYVAATKEAESDDVWVALMHRVGPAAPAEGSVFEDPRFGEHVAFLHRMAAADLLVAAGPLGEGGAGMTVLRMPGALGLAEAERLATQDDLSVVDGLFSVDVRPWQVLMHR